MADIETVIKALECCTTTDEQGFPRCEECPYADSDGTCPDIDAMHRHALELLKEQETREQCIKTKCIICPHCEHCDVDENGLLKEQEAVKPRFVDGNRNHFVKCGNCNFDLMHGMNFCPHCGQAVKWE